MPFQHVSILQIFPISRCEFWESVITTWKNSIIHVTKKTIAFYKVPKHLAIEYISGVGANFRAKHGITLTMFNLI